MQLENALQSTGLVWETNPGDGAFYGPKIDIEVTDALQRKHQCATIQLDFQLPERFELTYAGSDHAAHRPILIHRAILGSLERMMAILLEHTSGKCLLWLSPRQVAILPISEDHCDYAYKVASALKTDDLYVDVTSGNLTISKRVRDCQLQGYNFILVVGDQEVTNNTVNVRTRDNIVHGPKSLDTFRENLKSLIAEYK